MIAYCTGFSRPPPPPTFHVDGHSELPQTGQRNGWRP
jgi:hypothetical protein